MNIWVKQIWSGVLTFLQSSGVAKEKVFQPTALIEWKEMAFTELNLMLYKDIGLCLTALVISCV